MRLLTSAMLGAALLVAILLAPSRGSSTVNTALGAQDGPNYVKISPDASTTECGRRATPVEYGRL